MPSKRRKAATPKSGASGLKVRPLGVGDLDAIVAIDRVVSGRSRRGFYERRLAQLGRDPGAFVALGAEGEGRLVGFAFARLYEGEFGGVAPEASLEAIGVEAAAGHQGVGRELIQGMAAAMRIPGIKEISTQAEWTATDLMGFFAHTHFTLAPRLVLERSVADPIPD
jgi:GNAT superfamily N-acetyltransferase